MNGRGSWLGLLTAAAASAATYYVFFTSAFPLRTYYSTPLLDLGKLTAHRPEDALAFLGANTALFLLYAFVVAVAREAFESRLVRIVVIGAPLLFVFVLLFAYPFGAIDIYDYSFEAKMLAAYHVSPLTHLPVEFASDPWFKYIAWKSATAPYGPLWVYLSTFVYSLVGGDLLGILLAFKLLAATALLACAALAYFIVRRSRPRDALSAFALVAWNPLLLAEMGMNGHNDVLMTALALLALWLFGRRQYVWSVAALVLAGLVKAPALILVPLLGIAVLRALTSAGARLQFAWRAALVGLVLVIGAYAPVWSGTDTLGSLVTHGDLFTTSPAAVVWRAAQLWMDADAAKGLVRLAALSVFCIGYVGVAARMDGGGSTLAQGAFTATLLMLTTITFWFQPWYLVWLVPLAPLASGAEAKLAGVFSWAALWIYFVFDFAWFWNPPLFNQGNTLVLNASVVLLVFGPPLIYHLCGALLARLMPARSQMPQLTPATHH